MLYSLRIRNKTVMNWWGQMLVMTTSKKRQVSFYRIAPVTPYLLGISMYLVRGSAYE